jgi:hypothetical protein
MLQASLLKDMLFSLKIGGSYTAFTNAKALRDHITEIIIDSVFRDAK